MQSLIKTLKTSSHQRTWGVLIFVLLLLSIPLTLNLLQNQQDTRQRASGPTQNVCQELTLGECIQFNNICTWNNSNSKCETKETPQSVTKSYTISGKITEGNINYSNATIYLYGPVTKITTSQNGSFSFSGLPKGKYEVRLKVPQNYKTLSGICNNVACTDKSSQFITLPPSSSINFSIIKI